MSDISNRPNRPTVDNKLFYAQATFSLIGVMFCCTMLFMNRDVQVYAPILFSLIATWYPAPRPNVHEPMRIDNIRDDNIRANPIHDVV